MTPQVDLRSDTVTRPSAGMRSAMAEAVVADDMLDGDPTTQRLQTRVADLLGMEAALFFPSGVMANQTALAVLGRPGTEVLFERDSHVFHFEEGAVGAQLLGLQLRPVATTDGTLTPDILEAAFRVESRFTPLDSVLVLENTHLMSGGRVLDPKAMAALVGTARERGLSIHLDGARLWHAAAALGTGLDELCVGADTVMVALSKGLGAPAGSILAGSAATMERAWRVRRRLGGGMRQTGVLAAAALYALDHHMDDFAADHRRAARFADAVNQMPGLSAATPETNIVLVDVAGDRSGAEEALSGLEVRGVRLIRFGATRIRAVFHRDVADPGLELAITALRDWSANRALP